MSDVWEDHEDDKVGSEHELKVEWNARKSQYFNVRVTECLSDILFR